LNDTIKNPHLDRLSQIERYYREEPTHPKDILWMLNTIRYQQSQLKKAAKYMKEGKRIMKKNTTNSDVDVFIAKWSK